MLLEIGWLERADTGERSNGHVVGVADGDTIRVMREDYRTIASFIAPESPLTRLSIGVSFRPRNLRTWIKAASSQVAVLVGLFIGD